MISRFLHISASLCCHLGGTLILFKMLHRHETTPQPICKAIRVVQQRGLGLRSAVATDRGRTSAVLLGTLTRRAALGDRLLLHWYRIGLHGRFRAHSKILKASKGRLPFAHGPHFELVISCFVFVNIIYRKLLNLLCSRWLSCLLMSDTTGATGNVTVLVADSGLRVRALLPRRRNGLRLSNWSSGVLRRRGNHGSWWHAAHVPRRRHGVLLVHSDATDGASQ